MSTAIARLTPADFEEAMDVLNFSFGFEHPHNFETLLPVLYHPGAEAMSWNWALREEGSIRAIVGVFPSPGNWAMPRCASPASAASPAIRATASAALWDN